MLTRPDGSGRIEIGDEKSKLVWVAPTAQLPTGGSLLPMATFPDAPTAATAPRLPPQPSAYFQAGSGHWIQEVSSNGRIVTLEDRSLWEIQSFDQFKTALWLPITNIVVRTASSPIGDYKYTLLNKDDGEQALAKYLGKE